MQGLVYYGPKDLRLMNVKIPEISDEEVLIRVSMCGICGSDVHGYLGITGRRTPPMIMGHEFVGVVEKIGSAITHLREGDRVTVQPLIFCGICPACRQGLTNRCPNRKMYGVMDVNGAMADFIAVSGKQIFVLPKSVNDIQGSLLEPLAVAYSAVRRAEGVEARNVLVVGSGPIGLMIVQMLHIIHPEIIISVTDVNELRLKLAKELGAAVVFQSTSAEAKRCIESVGEGAGMDLSFEVVGISPTAQHALGVLRPGGVCVFVGNAAKMIEVNMQEIVTRELNIRGTYAYTHEAFGKTLDMLSAGDLNLNPIISCVAPMKEGARLFEKLSKGEDNLIKVFLSN